MKFHENRGHIMRKKRRKKVKIGRIIFLGILVYIMVILINQNRMIRELELKKLTLQKDIETLEYEIEELEAEIEKSDSLEFVEKVAREELGMVKPREIIVIDKDRIKKTFLNFFKIDNN